MQSNVYLCWSIFEYRLESVDLFQIQFYQISNVYGSTSPQKQNKIKLNEIKHSKFSNRKLCKQL